MAPWKGMMSVILISLVMLVFVPRGMADDLSEMKAQMERLQSRIEQMEQERTTQVHKEELAKMMKEILDDAQAEPGLPEWMKNLTFYGDYRLRFEHMNTNGQTGPYGSANPAVGEPKDRNRIRMRLRFGFTKTWWDKQMEVGFRLATGNADSDAVAGTNHRVWINPDGSVPNTENQTMTGEFSKKPVWIDLMYAKYKPKWAEGLEIAAGKMLNPIATRTMLTWAADLNPEGIYLRYVAPFFGAFKPYGEAGFWIIEENAVDWTADDDAGWTTRDIVMAHYGAGFDWKITEWFDWYVGATYYQYDHVDMMTYYNPVGGPDGQWLNHAGDPAQDYGIVELTTKVAWMMDFMPKPLQKWQWWFSWVHNGKEDYPNQYKNPAADRHFEDDPNAYGVGLNVGENKKKGDFSVGYSFFYVEYGSVFEPFCEADMDVVSNGPNTQGHLLKAIYNIDDFLTVGGTMILSQPIHTNDNPALVNPAYPHSRDMTTTLRLELVWKF
jgi:hypothetical protein